jgi:hypothetical protein
MKFTDLPTRFEIPFAANAGPSYIRPVPKASLIGISDGAASDTDGFPPLNFLPTPAGGVPPFGQDMNGILYQISAWCRWVSMGGPIIYNAAYQAIIGGYPKAAMVASATTTGMFWISLVDDNGSDPDNGGAGWLRNYNGIYSHFAIDGGSANAINVSYVGVNSYADMFGIPFQIYKIPSGNTGPTTINVNGFGAVPLVRANGDQLYPNDLHGNATLEVIYDNSNFILQTPIVDRILGPRSAIIGTSSYTATYLDIGKSFVLSTSGSGTTTFTLPNAATVGDGWWCRVRCTNSGFGTWGFIQTQGGQLLDGHPNRIMGQDTDVIVMTDGANWITVNGSYVMYSPPYSFGLGSAVGFNHNLNPVTGPLGVNATIYWKCVTAENGYAVGDLLQDKISGVNQASATTTTGISHDADGMWTRVQFPTNNITILHKSTGVLNSMTLGNWRVIIRCESK